MNGLFKIKVHLYPFLSKTTGDVNIKLVDQETHDVLAKNFFRKEDIKNSRSINFQFLPIKDSLEKNLMVEISCPDHELGQPLLFKLTEKDEYEKGHSIIDGVKREQDLRIVLFYRLEENLLQVMANSVFTKAKGDVNFFTLYSLVILSSIFAICYSLIRLKNEKKN